MSAPVPKGRLGRGLVLLVEDEPLVRLMTSDALCELGFDVVEAGTGAAALGSLQPAPALLVTDLGLPDMDGTELIGRVRSLLPGLPVIIASGRSTPPDKGFVFLPKPYGTRELSRALDQALQPELTG